MTKKQKIQIYSEFMEALKEIGTGAINDGMIEENPIDQLFMAFEFLKYLSKDNKDLFESQKFKLKNIVSNQKCSEVSPQLQ
jgi:hypothetical protein